MGSSFKDTRLQIKNKKEKKTLGRECQTQQVNMERCAVVGFESMLEIPAIERCKEYGCGNDKICVTVKLGALIGFAVFTTQQNFMEIS